jgi:hypothetical protein
MIQPDGPTNIYIAGPMTGYPESNYPAFDEARDMLLKNGYVPISPADMSREANLISQEDIDSGVMPPSTLQEFMRKDIPAVATADGILLIEGWEASKGANIELMVALICDLVIWVQVTDTAGDLQVIEARPTPDLFLITAHMLALNTEGGY